MANIPNCAGAPENNWLDLAAGELQSHHYCHIRAITGNCCCNFTDSWREFSPGRKKQQSHKQIVKTNGRKQTVQKRRAVFSALASQVNRKILKAGMDLCYCLIWFWFNSSHKLLCCVKPLDFVFQFGRFMWFEGLQSKPKQYLWPPYLLSASFRKTGCFYNTSWNRKTIEMIIIKENGSPVLQRMSTAELMLFCLGIWLW